MSDTIQAQLRPPFWLRLSVTAGNMIQLSGLLLSAALLYLAAHTDSADVFRIALITVAWMVIYLCGHSLGHYLIGRMVKIRFRGYGIRGTDRPEAYGPVLRQIMSMLPMFTVLTEQSSMANASPLAKALMFAAGETSTTVLGLVAGWYAQVNRIPGGVILLVIAIVWVTAATVLTAITPKGDYAKAFRSLRHR